MSEMQRECQRYPVDSACGGVSAETHTVFAAWAG